MAYKYLNNKQLKTNLNNYCLKAIRFVQDELRPYITFIPQLTGSGSTRLLTSYGKTRLVDLDYNLIIQRDKCDLLNNPHQLKDLFINAFKMYFKDKPEITIKNSTSVITTYIGILSGHRFSFDCAIMVEGNDGYLHKLVYDKNVQRYIWNRVRNSQNINEMFTELKQHNYWPKIKELYLYKKNINTRNKDSISLFIETIYEIYNS